MHFLIKALLATRVDGDLPNKLATIKLSLCESDLMSGLKEKMSGRALSETYACMYANHVGSYLANT